MLEKKLLGIVLAVGLTRPIFAKEKTFEEIVVKAIPEAAADALTTDLPVMFGMATLSAMGLISGIPFGIVPHFVTGACLGQLVRHTCKDLYTDGEPSVLCGMIAGATKYGSRSLLLGAPWVYIAVDMIRGSMDLGIYEMDRPSLVDGSVKENAVRVAGVIGRNELVNALLIQRELYAFMKGLGYSNFEYKLGLNTVKIAFLVPTLISTSFYTTGLLQGTVRDFIASLMPGSDEQKEDL
jgi:hypothetical protein